jgi:hypothetical protein
LRFDGLLLVLVVRLVMAKRGNTQRRNALAQHSWTPSDQLRYNRTAIILLFIASLSHAQDANPSAREMIQQLVQQVTVLQEKVKVLESQQERANGPSTADATPQPVGSATPQAAGNKFDEDSYSVNRYGKCQTSENEDSCDKRAEDSPAHCSPRHFAKFIHR